jgi:hypothetical protein
MSSISVSSLVLGSLSVEVEGSNSTLALSVLATAPAVLSVELGTPGAQGPAATIAVGTTTTLSPGAAATVVNAGTSSAAVFNFGIPAGLKGDTGNTGNTGAAATIAVGSTSTGAAGSSASVVNSGTSSAAVFDFTIPRGDKGDKGDTGNTGSAGPGVATGGTTGQFLSKASGTNYDTTWATIVPGDRYLTSSTTSLTIGNGTKSLTVGTGLSYTPTQNVTITFDASNHMHGEVLTYNTGTGAMTVDVKNHTGSGTYSAWVVNVGGVTPVTSTTWGTITGTLSSQVDLQGSLDAKLAKASNLSDLTNAGTARTNLGLGTAAVEPATKLVPAGGTTGQVLTKLSNADWDDGWTTISSGGSTATIYTTPGTYTYTIPAGATSLMVYAWGAGGGGGAGARNATNAIRTGGGGGGPGGYAQFHLRVASLGSSIQVVVAAGGPGGTLNTTNASVGQDGTRTSTRTMVAGLAVVNGGGGTGGRTAATSANGGPAGVITNYINQVANNTGGAGSTTVGGSGGTISSWALPWPAGGGGGGGAAANFTTTQNGGQGGQRVSANANGSNGNDTLIAGGAGGIQGVSPPTNGQTYSTLYGGMGGGGGGYLTNASGQNGAAGGQPGGGGGGGGAADNGLNGGAGGAGGAGMVIIFAV